MSSPAGFMDAPEWTPEERVAVALVESLRMKRSAEEQERAKRYYERHSAKANQDAKDFP